MAGTSQLAVLPPTSIHLETQHKALNKWGENGSFFLTLEHDNVSWIFSGKKQSKRGVLSKDRWMERERFDCGYPIPRLIEVADWSHWLRLKM